MQGKINLDLDFFRAAGQHPDGFDVIIVTSDFALTGCM